LPQPATLLSNVSPAVSGTIVVAPFPAGDVAAFDVSSGKAAWSDSLSRSSETTAAGILGDPALPVHVGGWLQEVSRATALPLPMLLTRSCATLGEAVRLTHRFERLFFDNGESTFDVHVERTSHRGARDAEAQFDIQALVAFLPDGTASIVLDGERHYSVDLDTGVVQPQD